MSRVTTPYRALVVREDGEPLVFTLTAPADKADIEQRVRLPLFVVCAGHHAATKSHWASFRDANLTQAEAREQIKDWNLEHPSEVFPSEEPRYL